MHFVRRYWVAFLIIFAVAASFVVNRQDSIARQDALKGALVTACVGDSARTALNSAGFIRLSQQVGIRDHKGDAEAAKRYRAVAAGIVSLIPAPIGREGDRAIAAVKLIDKPGRTPRFVLTDAAKTLQLRGCKKFYGVG